MNVRDTNLQTIAGAVTWVHLSHLPKLKAEGEYVYGERKGMGEGFWENQPECSLASWVSTHTSQKTHLCYRRVIITTEATSHLYMNTSKHKIRASLVAQWLRIRLPMQGTRVRALVQEDPTCCGATKLVCHNYWACALEPISHSYWACALEPTSHNYWARVPQLLKPMRLEPVLCNKRSHCNEKPAHCNEE